MTKTARKTTADADTPAAGRSSKSLPNRSMRVSDRDIVRRVHDVYLAERIETVLTHIRPLLLADGVHLELVDVGDNGASVRLTGTAVRCTTAALNFQTGLEEIRRRDIEGFGELRVELK